MLWIGSYIDPIGDRPIGSLTINDIAGNVIRVGIIGALIYWLFQGTSDKAAETWAGLALVTICGIIALVVYFSAR